MFPVEKGLEQVLPHLWEAEADDGGSGPNARVLRVTQV